MSDFALRDATNDPDEGTPYPGWIASFEAAGFAQIGRVLPATEQKDSFTLFGPEHELLMRRSEIIPTPILVSPDRHAFADIGEWFYETPTIRIRSVLNDGSMVETQRRWVHRLQPLAQGRHAGFSRPIEDEMMQSHAPRRGRSMHIADGDSAAAIWEAHQSNVARVSSSRSGAEPVRHDSIAYFLALNEAVNHHDWSSMHVSSRSMGCFWLPIALSPFLAALVLPLAGIAPQSLVPQPLGLYLAPVIGAAGSWAFFGKVFPRLPFLRVPPLLRARFVMAPPPEVQPASLGVN